MLKEKLITKDFEDFENFKLLYRTAFPKEERVPLKHLLEQSESARLVACYDGEVFCGFYATLSAGDITHILFLAVKDELRDRGYGSQMLELISAHFSRDRIILDIETPESDAGNNAQRIRRKAFYERNGYRESGVAYRWKKVDYLILVKNGTITEAEFDAFWDAVEEK